MREYNVSQRPSVNRLGTVMRIAVTFVGMLLFMTRVTVLGFWQNPDDYRWTTVDSLSTPAMLYYQIAAADSSHLMALAADYFQNQVALTRLSTDNGNSWRTIRKDSGLGTSIARRGAISFPRRDLAFILCNGGMILRTRDLGLHWDTSFVSAGSSYALSMKSFGITTMATFYNDSAFYYTTNSGDTWTRKGIQVGKKYFYIDEILPLDSVSLVVRIHHQVFTEEKYFDSYISHDLGRTWTYLNSAPRTKKFFGIVALSDGTWLARHEDKEDGIPAHYNSYIGFTSDSGSTWNSVFADTGFVSTDPLGYLSASTSKCAIASAYQWFAMTRDGSTWHTFPELTFNGKTTGAYYQGVMVSPDNYAYVLDRARIFKTSAALNLVLPVPDEADLSGTTAERTIHPNPVRRGDVLEFKYSHYTETPVVSVYNSLGQALSDELRILECNEHAVRIAIENLSAGVYSIVVKCNSSSTCGSFVVGP